MEGGVKASTSYQSLRDKMKKRRQAIESLLTSPPAEKKMKDEEVEETAEEVKVAETKGETAAAEAKEPEARGAEARARGAEAGPDDLTALLSRQSAKEREERSQQDEIFNLLTRPTARERSLVNTFKSADGGGVKEFCQHSTKGECCRVHRSSSPCDKLHFVKILQQHTDESLGDCSFLNTCFHMDTCKYIHYEVDQADVALKLRASEGGGGQESSTSLLRSPESTQLMPPQWVQCDLRNLKFPVLGKFSVLMADPPWDIHMELPYGTMSDDEMRRLPVRELQDEGLIFLWVTGRAMELGRECLKLWGYERVDEIIWVKTNQLQRIIRTGRTGHWLNHGKEHCLVGSKGQVPLNRGIDCDVIVAEVRATSHKPDEIYGIIERLSPGTRKIELFGRPHNVQPNWVTLGNQLDGVMIRDAEMFERWKAAYPEGYNIAENFILHPRQE